MNSSKNGHANTIMLIDRSKTTENLGEIFAEI